MSNSNLGSVVTSYGAGEYCHDGIHVYPKMYAGDPQYAQEFFNHCLCGKKRKVITIEEVDVVIPTNHNQGAQDD